MKNLSHLKLKDYFLTAQDGDYHISNIDGGITRTETKKDDKFILVVSEDGKELGRQTHDNPIK